MYKKYFGLEEKPFSIAPDPRFLFMSPRHREALGHLVYGVGEGGGFVQLTGEVGTGKTTISRCLLEQIPDHVDVAWILNPKLNALELLATICDELHVDYDKASATLKNLVDALNRHLLHTYAKGRRTVLIIDEAQNLSAEVLEQLRLLTNLETTEQKLLQILLIGQPELRGLLARDDMRQLAQRITARYHLEPLTLAETRAYIQHRLEVCGVHSVLFDRQAVTAIYKYTEGIPRLINTLCDRSLLGAYVEDERQVSRSIVRRAAAEALPETVSSSLADGASSKVLLLLLVILFGIIVWQSAPDESLSAVNLDAGTLNVVPVPVDVLVESVAEQTPKSSLSDVIDGFDGSGRMDAWRVLLGRWQVSLEDGAVYGAPCEQMHQYGLRCLQGKGTLAHLKTFNRPALISVVTRQGHRVWLSLLSLQGEQVELSLGGETYWIATSELADIWYGDYVLLWRPSLDNQAIKQGLRDEYSRSWLKEHLTLAQGANNQQKISDESIKQQVMRFQQQQGLEVDGVVGEKTLIHLQNQHWQDDVPHLYRVDRVPGLPG
ncbi:MAG: AAA family ATPase [Gammaproteobacteria bacterium]|nr:AAA family ATPase [Gammaproteobacteria bacterium]